jgi:hypothetical protein
MIPERFQVQVCRQTILYTRARPASERIDDDTCVRAERSTRILAGSGRGGTTWLLDALAESNALRTVFEPLHPTAIPAAAPFAYQYVPAHVTNPALQRFMDGACRGELKSAWSDYRVRSDRLRPSISALTSPQRLRELRRRWTMLWQHYRQYRHARRSPTLLVKCIRANLMLGWLCRHLNARVVLLLRHPGAVVESRLRLGGEDWAPEHLLDYYRRDEHLVAALPAGCRDLLSESLSPLEQLALLWCIENELPLREAPSEGVHVVCYEHLLGGSDDTWTGLLQYLALTKRPSLTQLGRPSQQAAANAGQRNATALATRWQQQLGSAGISALAEVLRCAGHQVYRADNPIPDDGALAEALRKVPNGVASA